MYLRGGAGSVGTIIECNEKIFLLFCARAPRDDHFVAIALALAVAVVAIVQKCI